MRYMGSKNRHAKEILSFILKSREENQFYVEPFVGGFNIIDKVAGPRIASDSNTYLIELFKMIQLGWEPPDFITQNEYNLIRENKTNYPAHLVGFVGFGCSYSGKWFGGYARSNDIKGRPRNHCLESKKNILKQANSIKNISIYNDSYEKLFIPDNSIIYCDPPYEGTTEYKDKINHKVFWEWCRTQAYLGNKIYVSEYSAPEDFVCLWSKSVNNSLEKNTGSKQGTEKLFTFYGN